MKLNNIKSIISILLFSALIFTSCQDEVKTKTLDYPNDVTFNEEEGCKLNVPRLGFIVPEINYSVDAFNYGKVTFNVKKNSDGTHSGFALSNKNYRSYPWLTSIPFGKKILTSDENKSVVDSSIFSAYTGSYPNQLKNFTVVRVDGEEAYFTIDQPRIVEHVLVTNTTYNFLLLQYGSRYSGNLVSSTQVYDSLKNGKRSLIRNPNIPDPSSSKYGVWYLPDHYKFSNGADYIRLAGQQILAKASAGKIAADLARSQGKTATEVKTDSTNAAALIKKGYVKIIAKGYNKSIKTGETFHYLAVLEGVAQEPEFAKWNVIQSNWAKWDLTSLGLVDKVVFSMESSDVDQNGKMRTPPYFCLDGIRIK